MYFGNDMKKWYRSEEFSSDYDEFKKQFITAFTSSVYKLKISTKLMNRRQSHNESVQSYYCDILSLCARLNPNMQDDEKILYLLRGLKPSIQQQVIMVDPKKCKDVFEHAKRAEAAASMTTSSSVESTTINEAIDETTAALRHISMNSNNRQTDHSKWNSSINQRDSDRYWSQHRYNDGSQNNRYGQFIQKDSSRFRCYNCHDGNVTQHPQNPSPLIYIQVLVNNSKTNIMIDIGSTISAINLAYMQQLNINPYIYPTKISCRTANNSQLHIFGQIVLPITINNVRLKVNTFIVEDLCTNLLLGGDFCTTYHVNINYGNKYLSLNNEQQQTIVKFHQHLNNQQIFTTNDTTIPPFATVVVQASTTAPPMSALFTPSSQRLNKQQVVVPHAILMIDNNHNTILALFNTTTTIQMIPKGTNLGKVTYHEDNNYCYVDPKPHQERQERVLTIMNNSSQQNSPHLSIIKTLSVHLPRNQQQQIQQVLLKHKDLFDISQPSIMKTNNVSHRIPIQQHHQPIQSFPYRRSAKETEIINEQVKEMLKNRIIRPSSSPWASPVVTVKKKEGSPRFCVDYRRLNSITERDVYPLPRIDDIIDRLAGSQYFTTLDLKAGYWQIPIDEQDQKKTAFVTTDALYEFNVLPFGLSNAPASFQRIMNSVLGTLRWDISLVYLDDIIIYSKSFDKHVQHLDLVLGALQRAHVKLNPNKCILARKQLDYLENN
ncbi:unnamed protein product [Rotaria magnacalcarata]